MRRGAHRRRLEILSSSSTSNDAHKAVSARGRNIIMREIIITPSASIWPLYHRRIKHDMCCIFLDASWRRFLTPGRRLGAARGWPRTRRGASKACFNSKKAKRVINKRQLIRVSSVTAVRRVVMSTAGWRSSTQACCIWRAVRSGSCS